MELKNAYVVYVNTDGDYKSDTNGYHVFTGEGAKDEVRALVKQAMKDLNDFYLRRYDDGAYFEGVPFSDIIHDQDWLDWFIGRGGDNFGNYVITIDSIGDDWL